MLIKQGKSAEQIAKIMKIDLKTVKVLMKDMKESYLYEATTEFAVVATASKMLIKAFPTEKQARQYIKNQYTRKSLIGNLAIMEVPKSRPPGNQMKGDMEVVKESVDLNERKYVKLLDLLRKRTKEIEQIDKAADKSGVKTPSWRAVVLINQEIKKEVTKLEKAGHPVHSLKIESVELDEVMSDREVAMFTKAHTALHTAQHKKALQIIKFIDSVEKHKQKWVDSFGDYVTAKLPKQLKLSSKGSVEYQQGRGRGNWSFIIDGDNVRYNNRDMPWPPKSGTLKFGAFMKLLDTWKKNANKPKSTGSHMGRQTESVELDEIKWDKDERRIVPKWEKDLHKATSKIRGIVRGLKNGKEVHSYRTGGTMMTSAVGVLMRDFGADTVELVVRGKVVYTVKKKDVMKNGKMIDESVELYERFGGDTNIPADKKTKGYIESGRAKILMNVPSTLNKTARFVVAKNPNTGSNQDKVMMFTISDPDRGRIKMFAFHGSHVSHQKAMQFAKQHKLVAKEDAKGNPLYAKESVELDEGKQMELLRKYGTTIMKMWDTDGASSDEIAKKLKLNSKDTKTLKGLMDESVELDEAKQGELQQWEFPNKRKAKQFLDDIVNAGVAEGDLMQKNKKQVIIEILPGNPKVIDSAIAKYSKKNGGKRFNQGRSGPWSKTKRVGESVGRTWTEFVENKLYPEPQDPKKNLKYITNPLAGKGYPYNESVIEEEPQSGTFKGRAVNKAKTEFKKAKAQLDVKIADIQGKLDSIENKREAGRKVSSLEAQLAAVRERKKAAQEKIAQATERISQSKAKLAKLRGEANEDAPVNSAGDGSSIAGLDDEPPVRKKKKKLDARTREFREKNKSLASARQKRETVKFERRWGLRLKENSINRTEGNK